MAGALYAGAGLAGLALLAGCQLVLDFSPRDDGGAPPADAPGALADSGASDAVDLCGQLEPNDVLVDALEVEPGAFQAAICPAGDIDYYRFELDGMQDLAVEVTFVAGPNDLELELLDADTGGVLTISTGVDGNERIERSPAVSGRLPAGTYAVRVFGRESTVQNDYEVVLTRGSLLPDAGP
jgi:hypothetical protein